jgi:ABC-type transporter Mla subunit MlaD
MRTERIALSVALAVGGMVAQGAAFAQENRGTMEQQMACTPDVWRLCSDQIPDVNRITACLQQNTPQLSSACRAVFQSNNQIQPQQAVPRGRAAPSPRYNAVPPPPPQPYDDDD